MSRRSSHQPKSSRAAHRQRFTRRVFFEQLEDRRVLAALLPYQYAPDHYDVNADGAANGFDLYLLDQELRTGGERTLGNPNGPVQNFWDVNGDGAISWDDLDLNLRFQTGTLQPPSPAKSAESISGALSGAGGATMMMGGYTVTLNPASANEGTGFSVSGSVSPPGMYGFQATMNWGQSPGTGSSPQAFVMTNSSGLFSIPHIYFDDGPSPGNGNPSDVETVTLSGNIMGSPVSAQTTVTVNNVDPVPQLVLINTNTPYGGPHWQVSGTIQDAGVSDKHTVTIDWGDGSPTTVISNLSTNQQFTTTPPHRYAPRQIHEGPIPYYPIVSVDDDDLGSALWEPIVPQYVFDLDNDADNNWSINENDDPIEDVLPGRFLFANWDDDNGNEVSDLEESPVSGENDLEPFLIGWEPRPDFDYTDWHLTLHAMPDSAAGAIWDSADKSGTPVDFTGSGALLADWVLEEGESVFTTLFLEAAAPGEIWLQLRLWTPNLGLVVEEDVVVFTALAPDLEVNLDIYDGLKVPYGGEIARDEDGSGAVTVANQNDTDADRVLDFEDDDVRETRTGDDAHGRDEVDLMKLIANKPKDYAGGAVTISVTPVGGRVKLWKSSTKQELVDGYDANTGVVTFNPWTGGDKEMWVEITTPSETVADVSITMTYGAKSDTVKATAVWATVERDYFETTDWDDVPATPWKDEMEQRLQKRVEDPFGGTGERPIWVDGGRAHAYNVMLMEFTITPAQVYIELPRADFDPTRQRKHRDWFTTPSNSVPEPGTTHPDPDKGVKIDLPIQWEEANDDLNDEDESWQPTFDGHMYSIDAPGTKPMSPRVHANKWWVEDTFFEYLRVSFGAPPDGNGVKGGQCSGNIGWHSFTTIQWDTLDSKWVRVDLNEISRGFVNIDDLPPEN